MATVWRERKGGSRSQTSIQSIAPVMVTPSSPSVASRTRLFRHAFLDEWIRTGKLVVKCDRIQAREWEPFANAIAYDNSILSIHLYCELQSSVQTQAAPHQTLKQVAGRSGKQQQVPGRGRQPAIQEVGTSLRVCRGLGGCLDTSQVLQLLKLENLMFTHDNLACLSRGLATTQSLVELRFVDCKMGDDGVTALYPGLLKNVSISVLQLDRCNLTCKSAVRISKIIQHHALRRHADNWQTGLRGTESDGAEEISDQGGAMAQVKGEMPNQRDEKGERLSGGLEKVMLAGNRIADEGASALASSLKLDLWMLELDLQSNYIGAEGGKALREALLENETLVALILKDNKISDMSVLSEISSGVEMNVDKKSQEHESAKSEIKRNTKKPLLGRQVLPHQPTRSNSRGVPNHGNTPETRPNEGDVMMQLQRERAIRESLEVKVQSLLVENHSLRDSLGATSFNATLSSHLPITHLQHSHTRPLDSSSSSLWMDRHLDQPFASEHLSIHDLDAVHYLPHQHRLKYQSTPSSSWRYHNSFGEPEIDTSNASQNFEQQLISSIASREASQDSDTLMDQVNLKGTSKLFTTSHPKKHASQHHWEYDCDTDEDESALENLEQSFRNFNAILSRLESFNHHPLSKS